MIIIMNDVCYMSYSGNAKDFLSVNKMLYKGEKRYVVLLYVILSLRFKNDKSPIKKLKTDIQVKLCFFMIKMIIH